jgi:uncharacterized protein YqeY
MLKEKINEDFMEAYKAKDLKKKNFLGVVKGNIQTQEGKMVMSTDTNVLKVLKSIEKGILENIESRKRMEMDYEEQELELTYIKPYMPSLMSEDTIREKIRSIMIENVGKNIGFLMGTFNYQNSGLAFDNKLVSKIIGEELA